MPFEIRKTVFFICPVCGQENPLLELPVQNAIVKCLRDSCSGRQVFSDPSGGPKPLDNSSEMFHETDLVPVSQSGTSEPLGAGRRKQRVSITIASALLINLALILTIVVLFYLVPVFVYRCSEGEPPKQRDGVSGTAPATEGRFP